MSADQRRAALRAFMKEHDLNVHAWSKSAHLPESALRGFLAGRTKSMNASTLERLARAAGASVSEIFGEGAPIRERMAMIKALSYRIELDGRFIVEHESAGLPLPWRRAWVDHYLDGKADNGRMIEVSGDTFAEDLHSGDFVCVHVARNNPARDPGIYCVWDGASIHLRRVQILPGQTLRMLSDNARYAAIDIGIDDVQIIGRAVWRAGGL